MNINKISKTYHLTRSEAKILEFISMGFTSKEIASKLTLSIKTIESHRSNCIKKMQLENKRNALLHFVIKNKYPEK